MPQDLFTIKRYALELNNLLSGAKVNKICMPSSEEVVLTLYNGKVFNLTINCSAKFCKVGLTSAVKENPLVAPNFCMLLRKHLSYATLLSVETINDDRIVSINFKGSNEFLSEQNYSIVTEIMGKYSNAFLLKNNVVLGSIKTALPTLEFKRVLVTNGSYAYPTKQNKFSAFNLEDLKLCFKKYENGSLKNFILNNFYEFSPVSAMELEHLILTKNNGVFDSEFAVKTTCEFLNKQSAPTVIFNSNSIDFYAFNYEHLSGERKRFSTILDAMDYAHYKSEEALFNASKQSALTQKITAQEKKLLKKKKLLESKIEESKNADLFKLYGELLSAYSYQIKKGLTSAQVSNYYSENGEVITIPLNENLSAIENAQNYYKKYSKLKNTAIKTTPQLNIIESELLYLDSVKLSISLAKTALDFLDIQEELSIYFGTNTKNTAKKQTKKVEKSDYLRYEVESFTVLVGKNNVQNDRLFKELNGGDIWFHVKNYPSCHAYILTKNREVPTSVKNTVAQICAYYSKAKNEQKVEVDYTLKKNVKKQSGKALGAVTYVNFKTLIVEPNAYENLKKMQ